MLDSWGSISIKTLQSTIDTANTKVTRVAVAGTYNEAINVLYDKRIWPHEARVLLFSYCKWIVKIVSVYKTNILSTTGVQTLMYTCINFV